MTIIKRDLLLPGRTSSDVEYLRQMLAKHDYQPAVVGSQPLLYDGELVKQVRHFQEHNKGPDGKKLGVDAKVGPFTWWSLEQLPNVALDEMVIAFVPDYQINVANRTKWLWIVLHTMEVGESSDMAERMAKRFHESDAQKSFHFAVDSDSIVQTVMLKDVAWHAPGANRYGIGIEHTGRASQTPAEWADPFSSSMLVLSAQLVKTLCQITGIPPRRVGPYEMKKGEPGICGHVDATMAFGKSNHTDPGKNFPWARYIAMVERSNGGLIVR